MAWTILIENTPGVFSPVDETFSASEEAVLARLDDLRQQTDLCHAAQRVEQ